jgi:chemotaxis protein CheX
MKMELIQPFINAADAVLAETLQCNTRIGDMTMEEEAYRRKGVAAVVQVHGDIEGRVIFDIDPVTATSIASTLAGETVEQSDKIVSETICELANLVIGNAVTSLNDQGFRFKIRPPEMHSDELGFTGDSETEALVMFFETPAGNVYMNIAMRYNRRRRGEELAAAI